MRSNSPRTAAKQLTAAMAESMSDRPGSGSWIPSISDHAVNRSMLAKAKGRLRGKQPKLKPNQAKHLLELHDSSLARFTMDSEYLRSDRPGRRSPDPGRIFLGEHQDPIRRSQR
jgi:hypothetical protein